MNQIIIFLKQLVAGIDMQWTDWLEITIIAFCIYQIMTWIKNTKAWMLLKGISVIIVFILLANIFNMHIILFLAKSSMNVIAIASVVVFQPEIRRALENLGQKNLLSTIVPFDKKKENAKFSLETVHGIVEACTNMSKVKTGALIVIEDTMKLTDYEKTGIYLDCVVSSQILMNIFEHNTPLHDGAIIVRGDRILSATCYLPLSENMTVSKKLGTRHRAALGISEVSDAFIIAVSEETGNISVAMNGKLSVNISPKELEEKLSLMRIFETENKNKKIHIKERLLKGVRTNEKSNPS